MGAGARVAGESVVNGRRDGSRGSVMSSGAPADEGCGRGLNGSLADVFAAAQPFAAVADRSASVDRP